MGGDVSGRSPLERLHIAEVDPHGREQLRLALALNGGVSLAVWIGGVCVEIERLVRGQGAWGEALELTQSTARVDVMAGASAGGINGALLAMALAHRSTLARLRKVWLDDGSLDVLFRSPFQAHPPSLLKGDEYFLERLRKVFREMSSPRPTDSGENPMHLMMTATLLTGERLDFDDDFGQTIHDVTHRGMFTFQRDEDRDDFDGLDAADRLALAARSTASFPGAFEASFIPVGDGDAGRPDMRDPASFSASRFVVDGGVLVNKPLGPMLRHVFDLPAEKQVRRVLAYVVPDPGAPPRGKPDAEEDAPSIAKVVASAITLPRQESIALELDEIRDHNRKVRDLRLVRERLLREDARNALDVVRLAQVLFETYRRSRIEGQIGFFLDQLTVGVRRLDAGRRGSLEPFDRVLVMDALRRGLEERFSDRFPSARTVSAAWPWDVKTSESVGGVVSELLTQGLGLTLPVEEGEWGRYRDTLRRLRSKLGDWLSELRSIRREDVAFWRRMAAELSGSDDATATAREALDRWFDGPMRRLPQVPREMVDTLVEAGPTLWAICRACRPTDADGAGRLATKLEGLGVPRRPRSRTTATVLRRLLAVSVVQQGMTTGQTPLDQRLSLVQISAEVENGFDGRATADDKLAGVQLGHFGAFYKRSWRANDWMWGRLDGAQRLAQVVLNPERIRKLGQASGEQGDDLVDQVLTAIERLVLGPADDEARPELERRWDRDAARRELDFLREEASDRPVPATLPLAAAALARRVQLDAIADELPHIADSIEHDKRAGAKESPAALDLSRAIQEAREAVRRDGRRGIAPDRAVELFLDCEVGRERITGEVGSDLLTNTASTAAAVTVSAARGGRSGLGPVRGIMGSLRGVVLALFVLARSATGKSRGQFAFLLALLAAGGAIVGFTVIDRDPPAALVWVGLALVLGGLTLAWARAGPWLALGTIALTAILAVSPLLLAQVESDVWWVRASRTHPEVVALVAMVLGSILLGVITERVFGWVPHDARLVTSVLGAIVLGVGIGFAVALRWPPVLVAAAALLLGVLVGWAARVSTVRAALAGGASALRSAVRRARKWADGRGAELLASMALFAAAVAVAVALVVVLSDVLGPAAAPVLAAVGIAVGLGLRALGGRREPRIEIHPARGSTDTEFQVTWSGRDTDGLSFDLAVRSPGRSGYTPWRAGLPDGAYRFRGSDLPTRGPGRYQVRARARARSGWHWGWSPPATVHLEGSDRDGRETDAPVRAR